jgi:hypothetical protein
MCDSKLPNKIKHLRGVIRQMQLAIMQRNVRITKMREHIEELEEVLAGVADGTMTVSITKKGGKDEQCQ